MNFDEMYPSKTLKGCDVPTPTRAVIAGVKMEKLGRGSSAEDKPMLYFHGTLKPMVCNKTNGKRLAQAFGKSTNDWVGKMIEVYFDPDVEFGGDITGGLRVRVPAQADVVTEWEFDQAVVEAAKVGLSRQELIDHLKANGFTGYKPSRDTASVRSLILSRRQPGDEGEQSFEPSHSGEEIPF